MSSRALLTSIIRETQCELDRFFRTRKARKVPLSGEDVGYLEAMLAPAIGPCTPGQAAPQLHACAVRFLRDFLALKTRPQAQLSEAPLRMVQSMLGRVVATALRHVDGGQPEPDHGPSPSPPPSLCLGSPQMILKTPYKMPLAPGGAPATNVFAVGVRRQGRSRLLGPAAGDRWLRRRPLSPAASTSSSISSSSSSSTLSPCPLVLRLPVTFSKGHTAYVAAVPAADAQKMLPFKKRRPSIEAGEN